MKKYGYIVMRNSISGANIPILKVLTELLPTYWLMLVRQVLLSCFSLMTIDYSIIREEIMKLTAKDKWKILANNLLASLGIYIIFYAFDYVPIVIFSLLEQSLVLVIGVLFGVVFLNEKVKKITFLFIGIVLLGLSLVVTNGDYSSLVNIPTFGVLLLIVYSLVMTTANVVSVSVVKKMNISVYILISNLMKIILFIPLPFIFKERLEDFLLPITIGIGALIVYAALSIFIMDVLGNQSIKTIGYINTQLFRPIIPIVATLVAMVIFQEWLSMYQYIGLIICCYGMIMIVKKS